MYLGTAPPPVVLTPSNQTHLTPTTSPLSNITANQTEDEKREEERARASYARGHGTGSLPGGRRNAGKQLLNIKIRKVSNLA